VSTLARGASGARGNALRVTAQLISIGDDVQPLVEDLRARAEGVFALEDEIRALHRQALRRKLVGGESAPLVKPSNRQPRSARPLSAGSVLQGEAHRDALRKAEEFFQQATEKDPTYALAWVGLAAATTLRNQYDLVAPRAFCQGEGERASALELGPAAGRSAGHARVDCLQCISMEGSGSCLSEGDRAECKIPLGTPLDSVLLNWEGRVPEAYAEADRAYRLDRARPIINNLVGVTRMYAGDLDGAIEAWRKTFEIAPDFGVSHGYLADLYAVQRKYARGGSEYDKGSPRDRVERGRGIMYALAGGARTRCAWWSRWTERAKRAYVRLRRAG